LKEPATPSRDTNGHFRKGNPGGPDNPHAKRVGQLRKALLNAVTPQDIEDIILVMVVAAKLGDLAAPVR
jgi:hypothetical protein